MADNKEKLKEEHLKDVNGGVIIVTNKGPEEHVGDGAVWFGTPAENVQSGGGADIVSH